MSALLFLNDERKAALEPPALSEASDQITGDHCLLSIAISMKRIADALNEPNEFGEVGSAALAGSIARGLRQ